MSDIQLTEAEIDSLTECECGHFANEHGAGCLASSCGNCVGELTESCPDPEGCCCLNSSVEIRNDAFAAIIAARLDAQRRRLAAVFREEMAAVWGGDSAWLTNGTKVAELAASVVEDESDE